MKHLLTFLLLCVISTTAFSQGLKGINIGDTINPLTMSYDSPNVYYKQSTVGGIKGQIIAMTLSNGVIYRVGFIPDKRIYKAEANHLLSGINTKYSISLTKSYKSDYSNDWTASTFKKGIQYFVKADNNQYMTPPCDFAFIITNMALSIIADAEAQQKANSDF
tara:strand:- start:109 stop:597 length:489 start_codon:yes stop_codon:yes gene_type:complete